MCMCCPPYCCAACYFMSAARSVGQPRSPEEIERQRRRREKTGLRPGERWGVKRGHDGGLPTLVAPGTIVACAREDGDAIAVLPAGIEMPERQHGESTENRV